MQSTPPRFDDTAKEEVRSRISIVDVVGRYVQLKAAGQNLKGRCPFHNEKTPSFFVNPARATFKCFGCGKGGDIFTFLQEMEGIDFKEALGNLAQEAGVTLARTAAGPSDDTPRTGLVSKTEMSRIHEITASFYYRQIKGNERVIDYFKSRGLKPEIIREFMLGYAPTGWSGLLQHMGEHKVSPAALVESGLAIKKSDDSAPYDRFRDRIMFTLFDISGKPIGFAGRTMEKDGQPKYLNSPETLIYRKSKVLYGLHKARPHIKEKDSVIIVEGYMDHLALYQAGVRNVVATSGTAMTPDHGSILRRFTQNVYLLFDGDAAGIMAAERGSFVLAPFGLNTRVLILPDDEDPDEFVSARGTGPFLELLTKATPSFDFLIGRACAARDTSSPEGKAAAVEFLRPFLAEIKDEIAFEAYVKVLSARIDVEPRLIKKRAAPAPAPGPATQYSPGGQAQPQRPRVPISRDTHLNSPELNFVRILVNHPALVQTAIDFHITPDTLTDAKSADLYSTILDAYVRDPGLGNLLDTARSADEKEAFAALLMEPGTPQQATDELSHTIVRLQARYYKSKIREITDRLKKDPGDTALLLKQKEISLKLKELDERG